MGGGALAAIYTEARILTSRNAEVSVKALCLVVLCALAAFAILWMKDHGH